MVAQLYFVLYGVNVVNVGVTTLFPDDQHLKDVNLTFIADGNYCQTHINIKAKNFATGNTL